MSSSTDILPVSSGSRLIRKLTGIDNYDLWAIQIRLYLNTRSLWPVVNGIDKKPSKDEEATAWMIKDATAQGEIGLYLSDALQGYHVLDNEKQSAKQLWDLLAKTYKKSDPDALAFLLIQFISLKWQPSKTSLQVFIDEFQSLFHKLEVLGQQTDPLDKDNINSQSLHIGSTAKATFFLNALPESWQNFVQIHQSTSSSFDSIIQKALQTDFDNSKSGLVTLKASKDKAFRSYNNSSSYQNDEEEHEKDCSWCKKHNFNYRNHDAQECRRLKQEKENKNERQNRNQDSANNANNYNNNMNFAY